MLQQYLTVPLLPAFTDDPVISINCDKTVITMTQAIYPFRLLACASQQTDLPPDMFDQCHREIEMKVIKMFQYFSMMIFIDFNSSLSRSKG